MGLRIMFMANAPWATTGYGIQGKHLTPRLKGLGHEMAYFSFYGLQGGVLNLDGVTIYPLAHKLWGEDVLEGHMAHFKADVLLTLMDVWVTDWFGRKAKANGWAWCPWMPVDQTPIPDVVVQRLDGAHTALPYAKFGEDELRQAGVQNVFYIPHGVNPDVFKPPTAEQRLDARRMLGIPDDAFVIGMVAANKGYPSRKAFPEQLLAFAKFKKHVPNAVLYLHTLAAPTTQGLDMVMLLQRCGLKLTEDVVFVDQYRYTLGLPEQYMGEVAYAAMDVLSLASMGEGFGIPLIEAQACGVPVVTSHNTACTELCYYGALVEKQQPFWTPLGSWAMLPDIDEIAERYLEVFAMTKQADHSERAAAVSRTIHELYSWDAIIENYWKPFLQGLEDELHGRSDLQQTE